jgi:hypothetical protein
MCLADPFGNRLIFAQTITNEINGDPENIGRWQFSAEEESQ